MELLVILVGVMGFFLIRRLSRKRARDKTIEGDSPLHVAAREGRTETVDALLADGADPNAKANPGVTGVPNLKADMGDTPLHVAAGKGRAAVVTALLVAAADRNAKDIKGRTPLHVAAESGHTRAAALLE